MESPPHEIQEILDGFLDITPKEHPQTLPTHARHSTCCRLIVGFFPPKHADKHNEPSQTQGTSMKSPKSS